MPIKLALAIYRFILSYYVLLLYEITRILDFKPPLTRPDSISTCIALKHQILEQKFNYSCYFLLLNIYLAISSPFV